MPISSQWKRSISRALRGWLGLLASLALLGLAWPAQAESPVVHALLLYSPTCPHCHEVMTNVLPPLLDKYDKQLLIFQVDVTASDGQALYQAVIQKFNIPQERWGVPTLIVGDAVLVGADEIPAQFPGLIVKDLAQGGVAWPDVPGLTDMLASAPASALTGSQPANLGAKLARDPVGNTLAIVVLVGMVLMAGYTLATFRRTAAPTTRRWEKRHPHQGLAWQPWAIVALIVIGFGVAGYLTYVEVTQSTAVCGPVGHCNIVQQSDYARLFGLIPIGALGLAGYVAILAAWLVSRSGSGRVAEWGALAMFGLALFGTLFSIYLTFLEPFVIGAVCAWCLTSAVVMTVLLRLTAEPAEKAFSSLF